MNIKVDKDYKIFFYQPSSDYPKSWNRLRHVIFERDHYICQRCGRKCDRSTPGRYPNCHHIRPLGCGGDNTYNNLITLCRTCHRYVHKHKPSRYLKLE